MMSLRDLSETELQRYIDRIHTTGFLARRTLDDCQFLLKFVEKNNRNNNGVKKILEIAISFKKNGTEIKAVGKDFKSKKKDDAKPEEKEETTVKDVDPVKTAKPVKVEEDEIVSKKKGKGGRRKKDPNTFAKPKSAVVVYVQNTETSDKKQSDKKQSVKKERRESYFQPENLIKVAELVYEEGELREQFIKGVSNPKVTDHGSNDAYNFIEKYKKNLLGIWLKDEINSLIGLTEHQKKHCELYRRYIKTGSLTEPIVEEKPAEQKRAKGSVSAVSTKSNSKQKRSKNSEVQHRDANQNAGRMQTKSGNMMKISPDQIIASSKESHGQNNKDRKKVMRVYEHITDEEFSASLQEVMKRLGGKDAIARMSANVLANIQ